MPHRHGETQERAAQTEFWKAHSKEASLEEMMLDTHGSEIAAKDKPEILSYMPPLQDKRVLELGAGIGRFSGTLAEEAKSVIAVDFMDSFCAKNRVANGHYPNLTVICSDVTSLEFPNGNFDVVFSNWLLMYLSDAEVKGLAEATLKWLAPGGYVFFRESCYHQSGDAKRDANPTHYRAPEEYDAIFQGMRSSDDSHFEFCEMHTVNIYKELKNNPNQRTWLWRKASGLMQESLPLQRFLDTQQYSAKSVAKYERVFGPGYVSAGGLETTKEFTAKLNLKHGDYVLDVGSGIGGGDFYMAETYQVRVMGIDLSTNMVAEAKARVAEKRHLDVQFDVCDVTTAQYAANVFDVVYSRDTILHIVDKQVLFQKFQTWLRPGGRLLISDYCCGSEDSQSEEFKAYVEKRGYSLLEPAEYGKLLEAAGFQNVTVEDRTEQFVAVLKRELAEFEAGKEAFLQEFSQADYDEIVEGWNAKLVRCAAGYQKWALFTATKN